MLEIPENESIVDIKKRQMRNDIIQYVYFSGATAISTFSKSLNSSIPSVTATINELVKEDWLIEIGSKKIKTGRKPTLYDLNEDKHCVLVIDINLYETRLCLINLKNKVLQIESSPFSITNNQEYVAKLTNKIAEFLQKQQVQPWAIGISFPGLVDNKTGINSTYVNLNQGKKSLAEHLQQSFGFKVFTLNDTKATLIGEHHFGLAKDKKHVLLVNLDWGIGLGVLANGELLQGASGFAGELGHIQIQPNGELCHCGKTGCLETLASASTLLKNAKKGLQNGRASKLSTLGDNITVEAIIEFAIEGDEFSIDLLYEIGKELGKGLALAVNLFNPEIIIIDGIMTNAGNLLTNAIEQSINKYCLSDFKNNLEVLISPIGEMAKIYGVKSYVFGEML